MTMRWRQAFIDLLILLLLSWAVLLVALWRARPDKTLLGDVLALLPDLVRLLKGVVSDPQVARGVRSDLFYC